jgi:hypothetical protein
MVEFVAPGLESLYHLMCASWILWFTSMVSTCICILTVVVFTVQRNRDQTFLSCISGIKLIVSFVTIHDTFLYLFIFTLCLLFFSRWFWFGTCDCLVLRNLYFEGGVLLLETSSLCFACSANALNRNLYFEGGVLLLETCRVTCFGHVFCPK